VRYRIKSWQRLDWCEQDVRAAVDEAGGRRTLLLGFSMGGAVAVKSADAQTVEGVLGLAPWLPDRLSLGTLRGKRLDVLHGQLDRWLPGIPGVSTASSRRGFERARSLGVDGSYEVIPGAVHGLALRSPVGIVPLPRAGRWASLVSERLARWAEAA
jgi:pimeloyl-ACP methyl ester carboxylesterase